MWLASKQAIIHPGILGSEAKGNDETGFLGSKKLDRREQEADGLTKLTE